MTYGQRPANEIQSSDIYFSFCLQFVHWMLYKELEKMIRLNAFEREKKKPGLNFSPRVFFFLRYKLGTLNADLATSPKWDEAPYLRRIDPIWRPGNTSKSYQPERTLKTGCSGAIGFFRQWIN